MEEFFRLYGPSIVYVAIFLGSLVEGESVVLTCSMLAYRYDTISLGMLMFLAFLGSMSADQSLFFVGRRYGPRIIQRYPSWHERVDRIFYHLRRHSTLFILSFRFIYGIRTLSPIVIGASGVAIRRFAILNFIAAIFWAILSCSLGYVLGYMFADHIDTAFEVFDRYKRGFMMGFIIILGLASVWYLIKRHYRLGK